MMVAAGSLSISLNLCNAAAGEAFWPEAATRCALATATTATTHTPATHEIAPFLPKRWLHHDMTIWSAGLSGEWGSCWCGRTDLQDLDRQAVCSPDGRASNDRLPRLWLSSLGLHDPVLWFRGLITAYFVLETASIDSTGTNKHEKLTETRPFVGAYFVRYSWDNHNLPCLNTDSDISRNLIIWNRFQVDTQSC